MKFCRISLLTGAILLLSAYPAAAQSDVTVDSTAPAPFSPDWLEFDGTVGLTGASEQFAGSDASALNWGGGELTGQLSLRLTDWHRPDCTPFCGPLWTNRWGARVDAFARGIAISEGTDAPGYLDLHVDQSAEVALWFVSIGQVISYQQDATFYQTFWRPNANTMTAGFTFGANLLSGVDETAGVEVMDLDFEFRKLSIDKDDTSPAEFTIDIALVNGFAENGKTWFEQFGLGLVRVENYYVPLAKRGETRVSQESLNLTFDFLGAHGLRFWDVPWKVDSTLGISGISPISEVRRTTITENGEVVDTDYEGGPSVVAPHLWFAVHHVSNRQDYLLTPSVIFESIPDDANFGMGAGSFQRLDASGFAVDNGAQIAAYARLQLTPNLMLRSEALGIAAKRNLVSALSTPLPVDANETFLMGRAEVGLSWALGDHMLLSADTWVEHSDRETYSENSNIGITTRIGGRAGVLVTY